MDQGTQPSYVQRRRSVYSIRYAHIKMRRGMWIWAKVYTHSFRIYFIANTCYGKNICIMLNFNNVIVKGQLELDCENKGTMGMWSSVAVCWRCRTCLQSTRTPPLGTNCKQGGGHIHSAFTLPSLLCSHWCICQRMRSTFVPRRTMNHKL